MSNTEVDQGGSTKGKKIPVLAYPTSPGPRGEARVYIKPRARYLARYGSAKSYVIFGLVKQWWEDTGEVPNISAARELAESLLDETPVIDNASWGKRILPWAGIVLGLVCLPLGMAIGSTAFPVDSAPHVDGIVLSADEADIIRGSRRTLGRIDAIEKSNSDEVVRKTAELLRTRQKGNEHLTGTDL